MRLTHLLRRALRRPSGLERLVEQSLREGVGLHRNVWHLTSLPLAADDLGSLATAVSAWVEQQMGRTRKPHGIDHLAVGLACAPVGRAPIASVSLGVFRPADYYGDGGTRDQIEEFVRDLPLSAINEGRSAVRIAAALFSWGDLARATVFRDD